MGWTCYHDEIANIFTCGATITSGRWMLHVLNWLSSFFGMGYTSLSPESLYGGRATEYIHFTGNALWKKGEGFEANWC